jgi:hypothetical protein
MKSKIAVGQGHPAFSDDRIKADTEGPHPVDDQRQNFTPKLMSTRCKDLDSGDPRVAKAARILQGRDGDTFKYSDSGTDRQGLITPLKRGKGKCSDWGSNVESPGVKAQFKSRSAND